jgi:hypothetical protein
MVTLWVLFVKCKAQGNTKEAILCKYSRRPSCFASVDLRKLTAGLGEFVSEVSVVQQHLWGCCLRCLVLGEVCTDLCWERLGGIHPVGR